MSEKIAAIDAAKCVEQLIDHAQKKLLLKSEDMAFYKNLLLFRLKLDMPYEGNIGEYDLNAVLDKITAYAVQNGIINCGFEQNFESELLGILMPPPSVIIEYFDNYACENGPDKACKWLFNLGADSRYIRLADVAKNKKWTAENERGDIQITINVSKPEKDNKQIAKERASVPVKKYPQCALCEENVGFGGDETRPSRTNLRTIPLCLNGEEWFFQFSPYVYYDQHCIAISKTHRPMHMDIASFTAMLDFIDIFPHYFIGSNAPLPIVGGSILAHDHFQGGSKVLPVISAPSKNYYMSAAFPLVKISTVDWYNSVVRLESSERNQLLLAADALLKLWQSYEDSSQSIISFTGDTPHSTITPAAHLNESGEYVFELILRNNRTDDKHPHGIFHAPEEFHNIKKEGIGIIEAMGLFILPGRLSQEAYDMRKLLTGETPLDFKALSDAAHPLSKHLGAIAQLAAIHGTSLSDERAGEIIVEYINSACEKILDATAVFKNTDEGQKAFDKFMKTFTD